MLKGRMVRLSGDGMGGRLFVRGCWSASRCRSARAVRAGEGQEHREPRDGRRRPAVGPPPAGARFAATDCKSARCGL